MFQKWVLGLVVSFVVRQVAKLEDSIDWAGLKAKLDARVRVLIPGTWFDDEAAALVAVVLGRAEEVLNDSEAIAQIVRFAGEEKWQAAVDALKDLLLAGWEPSEEKAVSAKSLLASL